MKWVVLILIGIDFESDVVGPFDDQGLAETWIIEHDDGRAVFEVVELITPERYGA